MLQNEALTVEVPTGGERRTGPREPGYVASADLMS